MKRRAVECANDSDQDKDNLHSLLLQSLETFHQTNPTPEDLQYLLHKITSKTQAMRWTSLPKDLWPPILLHLTPQDLFIAHQVCKHWDEILLTDTFWENFVFLKWHLDATIKSKFTVPAFKYSKLRIFLENNCEWNGNVCEVISSTMNLKNNGESKRVNTCCVVIFSTHQIGFVSANWRYSDSLDDDGEVIRSGGCCKVVCGKDYDKLWFGGETLLMVETGEVIEEDGEDWKESEEFGEIRRMLGGFKDWKELICEMVFECVHGGRSQEDWVLDEFGYCWEDFLEFYGGVVERGTSGYTFGDVYILMRSLEELTGLPLLIRKCRYN